jgi:5-deoxy-5-amino-3-dehydroquinate synthase
VKVNAAAGSYPVLVGAGARHRLLEVVPFGARKAAIVTQEDIPWEVDAGIEQRTFLLDSGEDAKNLESVEALTRAFSRWGLTRRDVVVGLGGGVVTDVAGFTAAIYHRGMPVVHVATTLLGQVDAAIGGKTGVNLPEGKNLVGAFHQPRAVFINPRVLHTLPDREYRCGLGEIAKYALMGDDFVSAHLDALVARDPDVLADVIARCVEIKANVVAADEYERSGARAVLNYGHTVAHALETATGHSILHGEAVAVGLVFAAHLGAILERVAPEVVARTESLVEGLGLPTYAPPGLRAEDLLAIMARDKKSEGGLTFVLDGPNGIERVNDPDPGAVRKALAAIRVEA